MKSKRRLWKSNLVLVLVASQTSILSAPATAAAPPSCPNMGIAAAKPNKLYLYFPLVDDPGFPNYAPSYGVSPAKAFKAADLPSYLASSTADLRDAITDVVIDDYCEFAVDVIPTTVTPPTSSPRRVTVAVGSDAHPGLYGIADSVDTGDPNPVNYARVFGGTYQMQAGGSGGALNGALSTLERWAYSIGGTTAHEAGHTYGLSHQDGAAVAFGEDPLTRHIMPAGVNLTDEQRAGYRRHFNDKNFSTLASNVGLAVETLHNWDFTNPNSSPAHKLEMEVLSLATSLTPLQVYTWTGSPWGEPLTISAAGNETFKGTTYHKYRVVWSVPKPWGPTWTATPGIVLPGGSFHVGATFAEVNYGLPDSVVVRAVRLYGSNGSALPLAPRMLAYDSGVLDAVNGVFNITFTNTRPNAGPLLVRDLTVTQLPRVVALNSMMSGAALRDWEGARIRPWSIARPLEPKGAECRGVSKSPSRRDPCEKLVKRSLTVPIARLSDGRHILEEVVQEDCRAPSDSVNPPVVPEVNECVDAGWIVDLFPSTTWLVKATLIQPDARHWSPKKKRFVVGPVESKLFYQVSGIHPDLNGNDVDDAIDIASRTSDDADDNGVPDDAIRPGSERRYLN